MWLIEGNTMPPQYQLIQTLGPVESRAIVPLTAIADEPSRCRLAYQQFLDQVPKQANLIYRFEVQARLCQVEDGPALVITYHGWAGVGQYLQGDKK